MDMIYISHPYTANEKENRKDALQIAKSLGQKYPYIAFVNPIAAMVHLKDSKVAYDDVLAQCKTLLAKCDGIIMTGNWQDSKGCMAELALAKEKRLTVWESVEDFDTEYTMPNDCCGKHSSCGSCLCRVCSERLPCWNCYDCTKLPGEKPIGYTADSVWECSRYRNRSEEEG